jgi:hypothetical protein
MKSKGLPPRKRLFARATETFRSELEAKEFARQKLADLQNITAGTLNPPALWTGKPFAARGTFPHMWH